MRFFLVILFSFLFQLSGAQKPAIPEEWNGLEFSQFADSLLKNKGVRIFFNEQWIHDIMVEVKEGDDYQKILERSFVSSGLSLNYLSDKQILVIPEGLASAKLSDNFFSESGDGTRTAFT
ncbi:MAG: hypothetical protein ACP5E3_18060, partial [Bacteroidales bacterium]